MARQSFESVDDYLAAQPEAARGVLARVRSTIRKALPSGEEVISYQIPAIRVPAGVVIWFAAWRKHYSLYPASAGVVAELDRELEGYEISKGTIRFPLSEPVPVKLVARVVEIRVREVAERVAAKSAASKQSAPKRRRAGEKKSAPKKAAKKKTKPARR